MKSTSNVDKVDRDFNKLISYRIGDLQGCNKRALVQKEAQVVRKHETNRNEANIILWMMLT